MEALCSVSCAAWLQVSDGIADVRAVVKTAGGDFIHSGGVEARSGCWSILKGGLTAAAAEQAELYFEVNESIDLIAIAIKNSRLLCF